MLIKNFEDFCCEDMSYNICIDSQRKVFTGDEEDKVMYYSGKFDEYGIPIRDGEYKEFSSYIVVKHCPWCGKKLPESKRDEWFETLEKLGYDNPFDENIPDKFKTSEWYSK